MLPRLLIALVSALLVCGVAPAHAAADTLSGVVRDPTGAPVTRIAVLLMNPSQSTVIASSSPGTDGAYSVTAASGDYVLAIEPNSGAATSGQTPNGLWTVSTPITIMGDRVLDLQLPTLAVDARTVDPAGGPVPDAVLLTSGFFRDLSLFPGDTRASGHFEGATAATGPDGRARLVTFPVNTGNTRNSSARPPAGSGLAATTFDLAGVTNALTITLPRAQSLHGVVRDATGAPVTHVSVALLDATESAVLATDAPGPDGAYSLPTEPGSYVLAIEHADSAPTNGRTPNGLWRLSTAITVTGDRELDLTIPTIKLDAATVGPAGDPVPNAALVASGSTRDLSLFPGDAQASGRFERATATTGADGHAELITFPVNTGNTRLSTATPPAETMLPATSFDLAGITTDRSLVIAFQQSASDAFAPLVSCGQPDGAWHAADVTVQCTASDGVSGLADPADASFALTAVVADGQESANAATGTRRVCDLAQNCTVARVEGFKLDRRAPTVGVAVPAEGAVLARGASVTAQYTCSDGGSGVATCAGPVPSGAALDTSTLGPRTFTVTAVDALGHTTTETRRYTVSAEPTPTPTPTPTSTAVPSATPTATPPPPEDGEGGKTFLAAPTPASPAATATPSPTATAPADGTLPPPVPPTSGATTTIARVTGSVLITPAGAREPVRLTTSSTIPNGSEVDASKGTVTVTVATGTGTTEQARVRGGMFVIALGKKTTFFTLSEPLACPTRKAGAAAGPKKKRKKKATKRSLWVDEDGGDWGTKGKHATTTVEGTTWTTTDTCTTTTVKVAKGVVRVKPNRAGKAVRVPAPKSRTVTGKG